MRILVTGGRGFVGVNVARTLAAGGHDVLIADRAPVDQWVQAFLDGFDDRVTHIVCDLAVPGDLRASLPDASLDAVIHAAVITATTTEVEIEQARAITDVNLGGTVEALEAAVDRGARRFVYVSSPSAIGETDAVGLLAEGVRPNPGSLYGITKLASEMLVARWTQLDRVAGASVRIAQPYGPGERSTGARARTSPIWEWLVSAERQETLPTGPLDRARDWTFVEDTAEGIVRLATAEQLGHDLYHLGTGTNIEIGAVVRQLEVAYGSLPINRGAAGDILNPNIAGPGRPPLDPSRFEREFGWKPDVGIEDGMARYLRWWRGFRDRGGEW